MTNFPEAVYVKADKSGRYRATFSKTPGAMCYTPGPEVTQTGVVVELPKCPVKGCEQVGKIASLGTRRDHCVGKKGFRHPMARMLPALFRELPQTPEATGSGDSAEG